MKELTIMIYNAVNEGLANWFQFHDVNEKKWKVLDDKGNFAIADTPEKALDKLINKLRGE